MIITILGRRWRLSFGYAGKKRLGFCEPPTLAKKRIVVSSRLRGERKLAILIHELLHAAAWEHDEEWVAELGDDIARVLWRVGYRHHLEQE